MAKSKVTMRDIAKECNVSVATVSYVLNHSDKEKISHDTFLKVTETATRLHYVPSPFYAAHVGRKSGLVGIIVNLQEHSTQGLKIAYYDLAAELIDQVRLLGFEAVLIPTKNLSSAAPVIAERNFDAIFMIDIDNETVKKATHDYYVPIIFLNCSVDDALFLKIYPDYVDLIKKAKAVLHSEDPFLIMEDIYSQKLKAEITKYFNENDIFINAPQRNLHAFLQSHIKRKGIVLGDALAVQVGFYYDNNDFIAVLNLGSSETLQPNIQKIYIRNKRIALAAAETLKKMLRFEYNAKEENRILIECELQ